MSNQNQGEEQPDKLKAIVQRAIQDSDFRASLASDPERAVERGSFQFSYKELSQTSKEILESFTAAELDTMSKIYERAKKGGIEPWEMF
jgi:TRAP-type mannitol/chloroaromatic compound transport system substrate-binding protein